MPLDYLASPVILAEGPSDAQVLVAARSLGVVGSAQGMLWRELSDPLVDVRRVEQVLRADPVVAARVVKVANSAFYRHGGQIGTVEKALLILGSDAVRGITAAVALARMAGQTAHGAALAAHCAAVASVAQDLAATAGLRCGGEAFLAGLLHDIGLLVEWRLDAQLVAARQAIMTFDPLRHARFGTVVLVAWQVPAEVTRAVGSHHESPIESAPIEPVAVCVRIAHALCASNGMGLPNDGPAQPWFESQAAEFAAIGIAQDSWRDFEKKAVVRAQQLRDGMIA